MISDMSQPSSQALWKGLLPSLGLGMRLFPLTWLGNEVNCLPSHGLGMKLIVCPHVAWEWGQLFVAVPIIHTSTVRKTLLVVLQSIRLYLCRSTKKQWKMKHDEHYHKPRENTVLVHSDCLERLCTLFCDFCDVCVWSLFIAIICAKSSSMVKVGKSNQEIASFPGLLSPNAVEGLVKLVRRMTSDGRWVDVHR